METGKSYSNTQFTVRLVGSHSSPHFATPIGFSVILAAAEFDSLLSQFGNLVLDSQSTSEMSGSQNMAQQFANPQPSQLDQVVQALQLALHTSHATNAGLEHMRQTSNQTFQHFEAARVEASSKSSLEHELHDQRQHLLHQEAQFDNVNTRLDGIHQMQPQ